MNTRSTNTIYHYLDHAETLAILPIIAFAPSVQMSMHRKKLTIVFGIVMKIVFDPLKGPEDLQEIPRLYAEKI